jgi:hypothetical protein
MPLSPLRTGSPRRLATPALLAAALAAGTLGALALSTAPALAVKAADRPVYLIKSIDVHKSEEWRVQSPGYSDTCKSWEIGDGSANLGMTQRGTRRLTLMAPGFGAGVLGNVEGSDWSPAQARRTIRYRSHTPPDTDACGPCGPSSEYGRCTGDAPPDVVVDLRCRPDDSRALLSVWLGPNGLSVGAAPNAERDLGTCEEPPEIAPEGDMQWRLETVTFGGAVRTLLGMRLYGEHTFRRHTEKSVAGGCRRLSGVGERSCVAYTTVVVVRRIG